MYPSTLSIIKYKGFYTMNIYIFKICHCDICNVININVLKNMTNNTMYIVQELHTFPRSFKVPL